MKSPVLSEISLLDTFSTGEKKTESDCHLSADWAWSLEICSFSNKISSAVTHLHSSGSEKLIPYMNVETYG